METQEKIQAKKPLVIWVKTSKVVGIDNQREPIREDITIKLTINDWYNWIKYVAMHGYKSVEVVKVVDNGSELDYGKYQAEIDAILKPVKEVKVDMKAELDAQKLANAELLKRLEALENREPNANAIELENKRKRMERDNSDNEMYYGTHNAPIHSDKDIRAILFSEAKELGLSIAKNIKTDELKSLIENSK